MSVLGEEGDEAKSRRKVSGDDKEEETKEEESSVKPSEDSYETIKLISNGAYG